MKIKVYNLAGKEMEEMELSPEVFNVAPKQDVLHQVTLGYLANKREAYAHTKTKGEVRGGGKKPWKQKGTGRARHGSARSPIWVGGGITFGPRSERNYEVKINKKMKNKALCMLLTDKVLNNEIVVLDALKLPYPKTKEFVKIAATLLEKINKTMKNKGLFLTGVNHDAKLASRNLQNIKNVTNDTLGFLDLMGSNFVICEKDAIVNLEKKLKK